jgi:hypothetical protein
MSANRSVAIIEIIRPTDLIVAGFQGPPGPPGFSSSGVAGFVHAQTTPATRWDIVHNLGYEPTVQVRNTLGAVVDAEVVHINTFETRIFFNAPLSGSVRLI